MSMGYFMYYPMIAAVVLYYFFCRYYEAERVGFVMLAQCREDALGYILHTHGIKVERRSYHRHIDIDKVVDKEAGEHHKAHSFSLVVSAEEIVEYYRCYHRIIHEVSHCG